MPGTDAGVNVHVQQFIEETNQVYRPSEVIKKNAGIRVG